jgi:PKD repeat protein
VKTVLKLLLATTAAAPLTLAAATNALLSWNNLGMHCLDSDFSVMSILPPYNTVEAQLIVGGKLVTNGAGGTVTYQAVSDPTGSFNSTSRGKNNFYDHAPALYGAALPVDAGLLLGTGSVAVAQGPFSITAQAHAPPTYPADWPAPFMAIPSPSNTSAAVTFDWSFGDSSPHSTNQYPTHTYLLPGLYSWSLVTTVSTASTTNTGVIAIEAPMKLTLTESGGVVSLSWPLISGDAVLEESASLSPAAWVPNSDPIQAGLSTLSVDLPNPGGTGFFRLRLVK